MRYRSWGYRPPRPQRVLRPFWASDVLQLNGAQSTIPFGLGRSYGDSCLNADGYVLDTYHLRHILAWDAEAGLLRCEAAVTLGDILDLVVPHGWFLPVTPGTARVTVGGAIANDIHGKNHPTEGSFGHHVTGLELVRSDSERRWCTPDAHADLFRATVGGLGLTGVITSAQLQLMRVPGETVSVAEEPFASYDELRERFVEHGARPYRVAWIDAMQTGRLRGVFTSGEHCAEPAAPGHGRTRRALTVPWEISPSPLSGTTMRLHNALRMHRRRRRLQQVVPYPHFFFPLDGIRHWNRLYGPKGLLQYQCVIPAAAAVGTPHLFSLAWNADMAPFLCVYKVFGGRPPPGLLSFPRAGVTLAMDFPDRGAKLRALLDRFDDWVLEVGGAVYPAKDRRMSPHAFQAYYPAWQKLQQLADPRFSSSLWRRVTATTGASSP